MIYWWFSAKGVCPAKPMPGNPSGAGMGRLLWGKWSDQGGGGDGDAGGGNGPGNIGREGMNIRAWVGGEGEQAG